MDAPIGEILEITEIGSSGLIVGGNWKLQFLGNAPVGWKSGHQIRLSDSPALGSRMGAPKGVSETRVQIQNLSLKGTSPITVFYEGAINVRKSMSSASDNQISLEKNIRLDRRIKIIKTFPGDVVQLADGTKWQLSRFTDVDRRVEFAQDDEIEVTKGTGSSQRIVKIINKSKKDYSLSATFISEE